MSHSPAKPFAIPNPAAPSFHASAPPKVSPPRERRRRPRVLLELPVRIRWLGPFGLETEITQTRNTSRDGLLVSSANIRQVGSLLWATFPYDAAVAFTESETPSKVARCVEEPAPGNATAISFHHLDLISQSGAHLPNNPSNRTGRNDRRQYPRIALAFFVRIERSARNSRSARPELEPPLWPEETMSVDASPAGILFCTLRVYEVGERLIIAAQAGRKLSGGERRARVVRVVCVQTDYPLSHVAVEFLS